MMRAGTITSHDWHCNTGMRKINRREFIRNIAYLGGAAMLPGCLMTKARDEPGFDYVLIAEPTQVELMPGKITPALTFNGVAPAPVLRARQGERIRIKLVNKMAQATTIHWHGIRIDNAMDGVPFISQPPVMPGKSFIYDFIVPDAGTFWYHPHINSLEQLSKGLVGLLIVEEKQTPAFDNDIPLILKKWRLDDDGSFLKLSIPRKAARMGTPGTWQTVNSQHDPVIDIAAGGTVRLRIANLDNTLTYDLWIDHPQVQHLAYDGMPLNPARKQQTYPLGPGMRVDAGLIVPEEIGAEIIIYRRRGSRKERLCTLRTVTAINAQPNSKRQSIPEIPANPISLPDINNAETLHFTFDWSGAVAPMGESGKPSFWAINKTPWPGMSEGKIPPPLAKLKLGKSYIFELENTSQYMHPIHLHGVVFTVLNTNKRDIIPYQADTVILGKYETIRIAFVADNPGRWMYHCHLIEHLRTGLMGYFEIA